MSLTLLSLLGCLDHQLPGAMEEEFVAFQSDFSGFWAWQSWRVADEPLEGGHLEGPRDVYINALPEGGESFPVGTLIVKTAPTEGEMPDWDVFAAAKRGAGYNPDGASGWEWFDLALSSEGIPAIEWRGNEPPYGSGYECSLGEGVDTSAGDCNACHTAAWENDYIFSPPLQLSSL